MSTNISEGLPAKKKAAPVVSAPKGGDKPDAKKGGTAENSGKRIRQAVYDIRYRARREDIDLKQAFSQYMSNTSMDQKDRAEVRSKLFGKGGVSEQYIGASDDWAIESFSKAFTTVFEHHQKDKDGNTIPHEDEFVTEYERKLSEEKARKYKVRVTDPKSEKSYVRYADREKITALRGKGLKVEMTEYGTPYEGEKKRGEETAKALGGGKKAKKDYDGDGKVESGSKEHAGAVHNAIQRAKGGKADGKDTRKEEYLADGTTSTEPTGKKINPKNVDNYKSGAVQVAPVDEADPQNGYGVKEGVEVKKKDNRANYAYVNFMKNKMRAAFGVKNVMPMVNPDEAEEKFEKLATSMKGTSGDEEEKEGACESVDRQLSDISKTIMERGAGNVGRDAYLKRQADKPSTNIPTESNPSGGVRNPDDETSYPSGAEIKDTPSTTDTPSIPSKPNTPSIQDKTATQTMYGSGGKIKSAEIANTVTGSNLVKKMVNKTSIGRLGKNIVKSSYDPSADQNLSDISKMIMEKMPNAEVEASKLKINKDKNFKTGYTSTGSDGLPIQNFGNPKDTKGYYSDSLGRATKLVNKPTIPNPFKDKVQTNSYDPLSNKEILGISEKILKKNFDLGEEGYDIARDEGKVKPSKDKKDATTMPPSEEMKKTQKKSKGKSALELVKAKYKDSIMDTEKKKEEK